METSGMVTSYTNPLYLHSISHPSWLHQIPFVVLTGIPAGPGSPADPGTPFLPCVKRRKVSDVTRAKARNTQLHLHQQGFL